ncbi:MAG: CapA family protein [Candidatus Colwellbacteria bacterium]|jgi:poly-gamma-glutamate synthesis protein (capsule biosynthesis protein)|nr:CapA family protein [Candidatus Colwellbacteria bacterium]MCK9497491.1 CapA family protein [Candidatus Colwellbacteria bacterium]MDD3752790.1 CapA family protein [Candidatus Colwellbacteria bacterium]
MKKTVLIFTLIFFLAAASWFLIKGWNKKNLQEEAAVDFSASTNVEENKDRQATIMFFGDIMLDRQVARLTKKSGDFAYPFLFIEDIFNIADANVANLEGPITSFDSEAEKNNSMRFTITPLFVPELTERFAALSLANNHTLDFGEEGLRETKQNLSKEDLLFFGDYLNRGDNISVVLRKNDIKIGLVGYHALAGAGITNVVLDIEKLKEICDFVVVMPHWGEEYELLPSESQLTDAKALIDAGADAVVGGHPHVAQPVGIYKGKAIFYSLGNFIFDQYFSEEVMKGFAVKMALNISEEGKSIKCELVPIQNNRASQPGVMGEAEAVNFVNSITDLSDISEKFKEELRLFHSLSL